MAARKAKPKISSNSKKVQKTQIDDLIIEMIEPKIHEIEKKFSEGKGLSQDDINTLMLKAQFNHINHLDERLNSVTADVSNLENRFNLLKTDLENKFNLLETNVNNRLDAFESKMDAFEKRIELKISEAINKNMKWSITLIALIVTVLKLADMFVK